MHPCVPHYKLPNSSHSLNPRAVSLHTLPNSTHSLGPRAVSVHALSHSTHCLAPHTASLHTLPLSTCCLTLRASYVTQHVVSFDALLYSTNVFSFHCLTSHILSTNSIIAVVRYWNIEINQAWIYITLQIHMYATQSSTHS